MLALCCFCQDGCDLDEGRGEELRLHLTELIIIEMMLVSVGANPVLQVLHWE